MKKIFSAALAVSMMATMAATSFAAYGDYTSEIDGDGKVPGKFLKGAPTYKVESNGTVYSPVVGVYGPFTYDNEEKMLNLSGRKYTGVTTGSGTTDVYDLVEYGDVAYYALVTFTPDKTDTTTAGRLVNGATVADADAGAFEMFSEAETVSSLKIKTKWEQGSDLVNSVSVVKKKVSNHITNATEVSDKSFASGTTMGIDDLSYLADKYYYFLAIDVKDSTSTSDSDLIGTITLSKSSNPKVTDYEFPVNLAIDWANSYINKPSEYIVEGDLPDIKAETVYSLKFDYDDEVELGFEDGSYFTIDVSGQGKVLLSYDNKFNSKVASKYPLAELNFWNGNGAKFNRTGEMFIEANNEYEKFIYMLNEDGSLSEVPGATYDKSDEGFYFYTRTLGSYVLSDMELDLSSSVAPTTPVAPAPEVTTPSVTNPSTGAAV